MLVENFPCPCCGYRTFEEKPDGTYEICPVCFWEDDPVQLNNVDYEGGANRVSLRQGQRNYLEFGACEREMVMYCWIPDSVKQYATSTAIGYQPTKADCKKRNI